MKYQFDFYKEEDFDRILELILLSYQWEYPIVGMGRMIFSRGLHPAYKDCNRAWEKTIGVYKESGKIIACIWNEGLYDGELFFLFDSKERAQEPELLKDMIKFAKTFGAAVKEGGKKFTASLFIPGWNETLASMATKAGLIRDDWGENRMILPFTGEMFPVKLPEGYTIIDGRESNDFYLANIHRLAFQYGGDTYQGKHGEEAFHDLRQMKHYNADFDLCVLDEQKRPVAFAILWYDERMPYCELEPLGVVWWERRKGIATALLHELANRMMKAYPACKGMLGGDQPFYGSIGYEKVDICHPYRWETEVIISWFPESLGKNYGKEVE